MLHKEREKETKTENRREENKLNGHAKKKRKNALMRRKGEIKETRMKSGQFLQWLPFGAYLTHYSMNSGPSNSLQHEQWPIQLTTA